jgi:hypothetical protein
MIGDHFRYLVPMCPSVVLRNIPAAGTRQGIKNLVHGGVHCGTASGSSPLGWPLSGISSLKVHSANYTLQGKIYNLGTMFSESAFSR